MLVKNTAIAVVVNEMMKCTDSIRKISYTF